MWTRRSGKRSDEADNRETQSSRRKDEDSRSHQRRSASSATSNPVSIESGMPKSRTERSGRDSGYDEERNRERRKGQSPTSEGKREKKSRDGSQDRKERKRERRQRREKNEAELANDPTNGVDNGNKRLHESTRGDFDAQVGSSGFMQFPGQYDGGLVGGPPTTSAPMSSHIPDQFPGQFPTTSARPYRPPLSVNEGGPGLAADYYGDAGQSVSDQPGVRPQQPTLIIGAEPHLQPASSTAQPPPEPSASGGVGAAASFFSDSFGTEAINNGVSQNSSSSKPLSTYTHSTARPDNQDYMVSTSVLPTIGAAAAGAAAGYYMSTGSGSHEQRPNHVPSTGGSQGTINQRPYASGHYDATSQYTESTKPGKHSSHSTNVPLYAAAAAAAGLTASTYNQNHQSSQHQSTSQPFVSGSMAQKHRHRGPLSTLVDFFKDPDGVAQFEEYTEYIGVCRDCFAPGSSARDAPRKHHYRRRRSNDRYGSSMRINKDSRYSSSDNEKRRRRNKSWLGPGITGYGLAKIGESIFNQRNDFDDTYSVKSGRAEKSHDSRSPDRRNYVSRGKTKKSNEVRVRHRSSSRERVETGSTSDGKVYKKSSHSAALRTPRASTHDARRDSIPRSRSRSHSGDRKKVLAGIGVGSSIGSAVVASKTRRETQSSEKAFIRTKHKSHGKSPDRNHRRPSNLSPERKSHSTSSFTQAPEHHRKPHKKRKSKGFFSFSNSSSASSSDTSSISYTKSDRRRDSRRKSAERDDHRKAELAVVGLGAAAAALALENTRQNNKSQRRGDLVAVKESKAKHRRGLGSKKGSKYSASDSEDDIWESASEGDVDSVNSDLAYGSAIRRKGSKSSISSDSSGTGKWGWRWGSAKNRSAKDRDARTSGSQDLSYADIGTGVTWGNVADNEGHDRDHPRITMHSNSSLPMQQAHPISTPDPSRHNVARTSSSIPVDQTSVNGRPEPVPIQHPQPITPVSPAVYTTQASNGDPYNVSTSNVYTQSSYAQHPAPDSRVGAYNNVAQPIMPGSFHQTGIESTTAIPEEVKPYRQESTPAQGFSQSTTTPAVPRRRSSTRENPSTVRFDLPGERAEREHRSEQRQAQDDDERRAHDDRQGLEEEKKADREAKSAERRSQESSGPKSQPEKVLDESHIRKGDPNRKAASGRRVSWAVPAAIGASAAAGAFVDTQLSQSDSSGDERRKRKRQAREARRVEDLEREERFDGRSKERSVWQEIGEQKRISNHEDYADFFTPTELLSKSPSYKEAVAEADTDNAITAFEVPEVITIEPNDFHDSREAPAYTFGPNGEEIDPDPLPPPWVPKLKLISPTPRPSSLEGSENGDVSPPPRPEAAVEEISISEASRDPQATIQDVLEEFHTPEYRVIEPRIDRDRHEESMPIEESIHVKPDVSPKPESVQSGPPLAQVSQVEGSKTSRDPQATIQDALEEFHTSDYRVIEPRIARDRHNESVSREETIHVKSDILPESERVQPESPLAQASQVEGRRTKPTEDFGDDLEFAGTLAAGLSEAGFDPSIVVDNPGFRRRESPPGSNEPGIPRRPFVEIVNNVSSELSSSDRVPPQQGFVEGEVFPHMPGAFEEDEPSAEPADSEIKLSKREQRKKDKQLKRQETNESFDKELQDADTNQDNEAFKEPRVLSKGRGALARESDEYDFYDTRSAAASAPVFTDKNNGKKKRKSKRDSTGFEDENSVVSTSTTRDKVQDVKPKSKGSKGGLFGLFGKSSVDVSESAVPVADGATTAAADFETPKKKGKKKSRSKLATQGTDEIDLVEADDGGRPAEDLGRTTLPATVPTPASTGLDPSPSSHAWLTNPEDEASARNEDMKTRESASTFDTNDHDSHEDIRSMSFLGTRQELPRPPDILNPEGSLPLEAVADAGELFSAGGGESTITARRSSSPLGNRPEFEPTSGASSLPSSPTGKYRASSQRFLELQDGEKTISPQPSPTAVPFHFRIPPSSPSAGRAFSSLPHTPSASEAASAPSRPKLRPRSTEFKSSNEFRPLWLVSKHASIKEKPIDEVYPSLPSSHTTSRSSSVHDPDETAPERTRTLYEPLDDQDLSFRGQRMPHSNTHDEMDSDLLDSQQPTPTATSFSAAIREAMQPADARNSDDRALKNTIPVATDLGLEGLPSLPSSKSSSPVASPAQQRLETSHDLKAVTLGAILGASAASAVAVVKHHQERVEDLESNAREQSKDMIEKENVYSAVLSVERHDDVMKADEDQSPKLQEEDHAARTSAMSDDPSSAQLSAAPESLKDLDVELGSAEQQRITQEQDTQDAANSWFTPVSLKQPKAKTKSKGKKRQGAAGSSVEVQTELTSGPPIDDKVSAQSMKDDDNLGPEDLAVREAVASVKRSASPPPSGAQIDVELKPDMPISEVVHRMSIAAETDNGEAATVTATDLGSRDDSLETLDQDIPSKSKDRSSKKTIKSVGDVGQDPKLDTLFPRPDQPEITRAFDGSTSDLLDRGTSSTLDRNAATIPDGDPVGDGKPGLFISHDDLPGSAENVGRASSKKKTKKVKIRLKHSGQAETEMNTLSELGNESNLHFDHDEAPPSSLTKKEYSVDATSELVLPETNLEVQSSKKSKKSKKARKSIQATEDYDENSLPQKEDIALGQPPLTDRGNTQEPLDQGLAHDDHFPGSSPGTVQSHEKAMPSGEQPTVATSPQIRPEAVALPSSEDLDLLDETPGEPHIDSDLSGNGKSTPGPILTRILTPVATPQEEFVARPYGDADQQENDINLADFASSIEGSKGKQKPSKVESARSYFDLDQVDAISSDEVVNPLEDNRVIRGDQNTSSTSGTETERLMGSSERQPSKPDIVAMDRAQTELKSISPHKTKLPKHESSFDDLGPPQDSQQTELSVSGLNRTASSPTADIDALGIESSGESHNMNQQEAEPHRTVSDKLSPDLMIDDGVRQAIDNRNLPMDSRTPVSNEQRSDPIDVEPEADIYASKLRFQQPEHAVYSQGTSHPNSVAQQSLEQIDSESTLKSHDTLLESPEPDPKHEDKSEAPFIERPISGGTLPPIKSELQSLPQDERTQESVGDSLSASSRQNPAIGGSRPEDTGSVESSKHVQIPGVDSPPMTDDIPSELQIADQLPLISDLADAAEIEDVHNASKPSASTTTSQAVKDILAMQAKIPIEEKAPASVVTAHPASEPAISPKEERHQEGFSWGTSTKKEKKIGKRVKRDQAINLGMGNTEDVSMTDPPIAMTNTAESVEDLLGAEISEQASSPTEAKQRYNVPSEKKKVAEDEVDEDLFARTSSKKNKKNGTARPKEKEDSPTVTTGTLDVYAQQTQVSTKANDEALLAPELGTARSESPKPLEDPATADTLSDEVMEPIDQSKELLDPRYLHSKPAAIGQTTTEIPTIEQPVEASYDEPVSETQSESFNEFHGSILPRVSSNSSPNIASYGNEHQPHNFTAAALSFTMPSQEAISNDHPSGPASAPEKPLITPSDSPLPVREVSEVSDVTKTVEEAVDSSKPPQSTSSMSKKDKKKLAKDKRSASKDELPNSDAGSQAPLFAPAVLTESKPAMELLNDTSKSGKKRRSKKTNQSLLLWEDDTGSSAGQEISSPKGGTSAKDASKESRVSLEEPIGEGIDSSVKAAKLPEVSAHDKAIEVDSNRTVELPKNAEADTYDISPVRSADASEPQTRETASESIAGHVDILESTSTAGPEDFSSGKKKGKKNKRREKCQSSPWEEDTPRQAEESLGTEPSTGASVQRPEDTFILPVDVTRNDLFSPGEGKRSKKSKKRGSLTGVEVVEAPSAAENTVATNPEVFEASTQNVQEGLPAIKEVSEEPPVSTAVAGADSYVMPSPTGRVDEAITESRQLSPTPRHTEGEHATPIIFTTKKEKKKDKKARKSKNLNWDESQASDMRLENYNGADELDDAQRVEDLGHVGSTQKLIIGPEDNDAPVEQTREQGKGPDAFGSVEVQYDETSPSARMKLGPDTSSTKKKKKDKKKSSKQPMVLDVEEEAAQAAPQVIEEPMVERLSTSPLPTPLEEPIPKPKLHFSDGVADEIDSSQHGQAETPTKPQEALNQSHDMQDVERLQQPFAEMEQLATAPVVSQQGVDDDISAVPPQLSPEQAHKRSFFEEEGPEMVAEEEAAIEPPSKAKRTDADPPSKKMVEMEEEALSLPRKSKKKSKRGATTGMDLEEPRRPNELHEIKSGQRNLSTEEDLAKAEKSIRDDDLQPQIIPQAVAGKPEGHSRETEMESDPIKTFNEPKDNDIDSWDLPVKKSKKGKKQRPTPYSGVSEPKVAEGESIGADAQATKKEEIGSADIQSQHSTTSRAQNSTASKGSTYLHDAQILPGDEAQPPQDNDSSVSVLNLKNNSKKKKRKQPVIWEDETATPPVVERPHEHVAPIALQSSQRLSATPEPGPHQTYPGESREPTLTFPLTEDAALPDSPVRHTDEQSDYFSLRAQDAGRTISADPHAHIYQNWEAQKEEAISSLEKPGNKAVELDNIEYSAIDAMDNSKDLPPTSLEMNGPADMETSHFQAQTVPTTQNLQMLDTETKGQSNAGSSGTRDKFPVVAAQDAMQTDEQLTEDAENRGNEIVGALSSTADLHGAEARGETGAKEEEETTGEGDITRSTADEHESFVAGHPVKEEDIGPIVKSKKSKKKSKRRAPAAENNTTRDLEDLIYQGAREQRLETTKLRSRSSSPRQLAKSIGDPIETPDIGGIKENIGDIAGAAGTAAIMGPNLIRKDSKRDGKSKKKKKSTRWEEEETEAPESKISHAQEMEENRQSPLPQGDPVSTPPKSPEAFPGVVTEGNSVHEGVDAREHRSINRDSAIHVADSPNTSHNLPSHRVVRDSGYQETEASPIEALRSVASNDGMNVTDTPFSFARRQGNQRHGDQNIDFSEGPVDNPFNISVDAGPTDNAEVLSPASEPYHDPGSSNAEPDQRSFADAGFGVLGVGQSSMPLENERYRSPPYTPATHHDQRTGEFDVLGDVLPTPNYDDDRRQPSPVSPSSKDRSSVLFQSSPSTRDEVANVQKLYSSPPRQDELSNERALSPVGLDEHRAPEGPSHQSLFGGPHAAVEDLPSPPRSPFANEASYRQPLDTIKENSPEDSPLQRKTRTRSYSPSPERGNRRRRRTDMQQRGHSPQFPNKDTQDMVFTDDTVPWPAVDQEQHSVELERSRSRNAENRAPSRQSVVSPVGGPPKQRDGDYRSFSGASIKSGDSINAIIRTPDQVRSASGLSYHSSGTPPLRRVDRSVSGDLRAKSLAKQNEAETSQSQAIASSSSYDPTKDKGKTKMADVYEGWGDVHSGSPMSPSRPQSIMRKRQSMQILDLESRLDQLVSENRLLQDAKSRAERNLDDASQDSKKQNNALREAIESRDLYLRQKDDELRELRQILEGFQSQVSQLTEVNESLTADRTLVADHKQRYSQLEAEHAHTREQWQHSTRELDELRQQHANLSGGMEAIVKHEIDVALEARNAELRQVRDELEAAKDQVRALQQQILASRSKEDFIMDRDEDYFDGQCQKLCQHVQQWVLRFSKFSDMKACFLASEVADEKIVDRMENAILDGSDVDFYLADRVKRRDVFMSVVMTMVWEYIFTRYLFGMDREQRQKLKALEKTLSEVGPPSAVNKWRATTLNLLAKRDAFLNQRAQDTEAVVNEIYSTLATFLPPPSHLVDQIQDSLRKVIGAAVDLSIEMRTQRAEYIMLPPLQPEYDTNGDLARKVYFNASLMNERSGATSSNEALEAQQAVVRMVLFPLVVKKGDEAGVGDEQIVVCPAQVLTAPGAKEKKTVRVSSAEPSARTASYAGSDFGMGSDVGMGGMI